MPSFDLDEKGNPIPLQYYLERDRTEGYETYVLVEGGLIQGIVSFNIRSFTNEHDTLYLSRIGVRKGQQGKGYGARLWQFIYEQCIDRGVVIMCCEALREVVPFFTSLGWEIILTYDDPHWGPDCATLIFRVPC